MKKPRDNFIDDGRVVAPMNVAGMPWYDGGAQQAADGGDGAGKAPEAEPGDVFGQNAGEPFFQATTGSKKETFAMLRGVLLACLAVAAAFALGFWLFVEFCLKLWLK